MYFDIGQHSTKIFYRTRTLFLLIIFFLSQVNIYAQDAGFFLDSWTQKIAELPSFKIAVKTDKDPDVTISLDAEKVINKVPGYVYGNNMITWDNELTNSTTGMTDAKNLNAHVIRWPGGSLSDYYFWNQSFQDRPTDIPETINPWYGMDTPDWQMSVDEYYQFLEDINCMGHIIVNYGYARYGTSEDPVAKAAHMAAEWVRYDNGRSKFWEIGNENYGSWESGHQIDPDLNQDGQPEIITGTLYGQHCRIFIDSMRAAAVEVGTDIKIGIVLFNAEESSYDPNQTNWNEQVLTEVGELADFASVHTYFTPKGENTSAARLLELYDIPGKIFEIATGDMLEVEKPQIPLAMTEWNIFSEGSMQQVSFINGMLAAMVWGEFIEKGYGMANRWILTNAWNNGNDHGTFSRGGEPGVDLYNPRPVFFYMYYFQKFFGDRMIFDTVTGNNDIISYASTFSSGETGIIIVNKGIVSETTAIEISNLEYGYRYYTYTLTGGQDNGDFSLKVNVNGEGTDEAAGGPDHYANIKANGYITEGGITVNLPPRSVVYMLVDNKDQLPPDPVSVNFTVKNTQSSQVIENCSVNFNGESALTDVNGKATFTAIPGFYNVSASRSHMDSIKEQEIFIPENDTNIVLWMDSTRYSLSFLVLDEEGEPLTSAAINIGKQDIKTGGEGVAITEIFAGSYTYKAEVINYFNNAGEIQILSDTIFTLVMVQSHAEVKFSLMLGEMPVNDALVVLGTDSLYSNSVGICKFPSVLLDSYLSYQITRKGYYKVEGALMIEKDTTLNIFMEKSVANLAVNIHSETGLVQYPYVYIDQDTIWFDTEGRAVFYGLPKNVKYKFIVESQNAPDYIDSVYLTSDTVIMALLAVDLQSDIYPEHDIRIYPNPVTNEFILSSNQDDVRFFELYDINGETIFSKKIIPARNKLLFELNIPAGIYLVRIYMKDKIFTDIIIKK
ncbi:MAG: T9SS type A sorting domain-containing protein [Bacteroidales bacterium]|nr:T9SS type A sorting domain-containing protein [Bacteroidales bacterium]